MSQQTVLGAGTNASVTQHNSSTGGWTHAGGGGGLTKMFVPISHAAKTWTNQPAGPTESSVNDRVVVNLTTGFTNVLFRCHVSTGGTTAVFKLQYSTDASVWSDLTTTISSVGTGLKASASQAIPAGAKALIIIRFVATGGNGVEDPVTNAVVMELS